MISRQLELGFESRPGMRLLRRSRSRSYRAHWWFENMRGVVDTARDWPPTCEAKKPLPGAEEAVDSSQREAASSLPREK